MNVDLSQFDGHACAGINSSVTLDDARSNFMAMVIPGEGCWGWRGRLDANGYARLGRNLWAHRVSHVLFIGPIPTGYHVDHVRERGCRSTACTNPAHLEAVTPEENNRRAEYERATHCRRGHDKRGRKDCPVCMVERRDAWYDRTCRSTFSPADLAEVHALLAAGLKQAEIGTRFGVHQLVISYIKRSSLGQEGPLGGDMASTSRLRGARFARKLSQRELGRLVGVSSSTITNWEHGKRPPSHALRVRLVDALGVDPWSECERRPA